MKLINGEKATFQTPTFSKKRERTLEMLIKDLFEEYIHDSKLVSDSRIPAEIYLRYSMLQEISMFIHLNCFLKFPGYRTC